MIEEERHNTVVTPTLELRLDWFDIKIHILIVKPHINAFANVM